MTKLKYHKKILVTIIVVLMFILLWGDYMSGFAIFSKIQYDNVISDMHSVEATVIDITGEHNTMVRGRNWRWIHVTYEVNGIMYDTELEMVVDRLFEINNVNYSVGDKITIFYEPENPEKIEYSNSLAREELYEFICLGAFVLTIVIDFILDRWNKSADSKKKAKESST